MKFIKNLKSTALLSMASVLFAGGALAHDFVKGDITVVEPWTRATPVHAKVGGAYAHIFNKGNEDDALVSVTSDVSDNIQLHEMIVQNNVMKMHHLEKPLVIPAHGDVELKPGSFHIMFMQLKHDFVAGQPFAARLHFQKAGDINVTFDVAPMGTTTPPKSN